MTAALDLKKRGYYVELCERSRLLGGKATSFEVDGIEVDNGQHVFLACCTEFIDFIEGLGLSMGHEDTGESQIYLQPRFEALLLSRSQRPTILRALPLPAPLHLLKSLLMSHHLGLRGRLEVGLALLFLGSDQVPGETFDCWLRRYRQGDKARKGFWQPFVVPALNAPLDEVSVQAAAFVIRTAFLEDAGAGRFGYTRLPLARLAGRAAAGLDEVRLRTPVLSIDEAGNGVRVELSDGRAEMFDAVVLAVPPERLKSVLKEPKRYGVYGLDQFRTAPIVDVHLWFDLPPGSVFGKDISFAALLDSPIQWVFEKPAPSGETYLCCSMSAAGQHVGDKSTELVELASRELQAVLPSLREARRLRGAATRDRDATFVPSIGLIRPGPETTSPKVVLAGAWTDTGWPATMESAVRSGKKAAEVLHGAMAA